MESGEVVSCMDPYPWCADCKTRHVPDWSGCKSRPPDPPPPPSSMDPREEKPPKPMKGWVYGSKEQLEVLRLLEAADVAEYLRRFRKPEEQKKWRWDGAPSRYRWEPREDPPGDPPVGESW